MNKYSIILGLTSQDYKKTWSVTNAQKQVIKLVGKTIDGLSFKIQSGVWKGKIEKSLCIEVIDFESLYNSDMMKSVAENLRTSFNQEAVILQVENVQQSYLIQ